jgi:hypothetical protein
MRLRRHMGAQVLVQVLAQVLARVQVLAHKYLSASTWRQVLIGKYLPQVLADFSWPLVPHSCSKRSKCSKCSKCSKRSKVQQVQQAQQVQQVQQAQQVEMNINTSRMYCDGLEL